MRVRLVLLACGEVEISQFGLTPEFIGQGLGRYFLQ